MWRVRRAATFADLRRSGRRARCGPVSLTWLPGEPSQPPQLAYAVGRPVGTAVRRNRLRRRLQAVMAELAADLPPGTYLIGATAGAADLDHGALRQTVTTALAELQQ